MVKSPTLIFMVAVCALVAVLFPGCGNPSAVYESTAYGLSFHLPAGWEIVGEHRRGEVLTLQLQDKAGAAASITVTVIPAAIFEHEEAAVDRAEKLLRQSLFALQEPVERQVLILESGEVAPLVTARAGEREAVLAQASVIYGDSYHAVIVLVIRAEHAERFRVEFRDFLNTFILK